MEGIKEKINADFIEAFKSKDSVKKNLLGVIRGEIQTKEKAPGATQLTDAEVMAVISKSYKNITETLAQVGSNAELEAEAKVLEAYLPKQLTIEEISSELEKIVVEVGATSARDTGKIMGAFNKKFAGQFNGKDVSACVGKYFSENN